MPSIKRNSRERPFTIKYKGKEKEVKETRKGWGNPKNYKFYNSRKWRLVAKNYRSKNPLCVNALTRNIRIPSEVTDHIIPIEHGGAKWDARNFQALCRSEHNIKSLKEKKRPLYKWKLNDSGDKIPERDKYNNLIVNI